MTSILDKRTKKLQVRGNPFTHLGSPTDSIPSILEYVSHKIECVNGEYIVTLNLIPNFHVNPHRDNAARNARNIPHLFKHVLDQYGFNTDVSATFLYLLKNIGDRIEEQTAKARTYIGANLKFQNFDLPDESSAMVFFCRFMYLRDTNSAQEMNHFYLGVIQTVRYGNYQELYSTSRVNFQLGELDPDNISINDVLEFLKLKIPQDQVEIES